MGAHERRSTAFQKVFHRIFDCVWPRNAPQHFLGAQERYSLAFPLTLTTGWGQSSILNMFFQFNNYVTPFRTIIAPPPCYRLSHPADPQKLRQIWPIPPFDFSTSVETISYNMVLKCAKCYYFISFSTINSVTMHVFCYWTVGLR